MTQLQLIEIDPTPGGIGLPEIRTIKAVSSSYQALVEHCKEKFNSSIGMKEKIWDVYYEIEDSEIVIVQESISKFD